MRCLVDLLTERRELYLSMEVQGVAMKADSPSVSFQICHQSKQWRFCFVILTFKGKPPVMLFVYIRQIFLRLNIPFNLLSSSLIWLGTSLTGDQNCFGCS